MTSPDSRAQTRHLHRRTLVKGAAWSAPIMIASTTLPAFAASTGTQLRFERDSYDFPDARAITLVGTIVPASGGSAPTDLTLTVSLPDGFVLLSGPVVAGSVFTLTVSPPPVAAQGTIVVAAPGHSNVGTATATLRSTTPGGILGTGLMPIPLADFWKRTHVDERGVEWFHPDAAHTPVAGIRKYLDMRFALARVGSAEYKAGNYGAPSLQWNHSGTTPVYPLRPQGIDLDLAQGESLVLEGDSGMNVNFTARTGTGNKQLRWDIGGGSHWPISYNQLAFDKHGEVTMWWQVSRLGSGTYTPPEHMKNVLEHTLRLPDGTEVFKMVMWCEW